MGFREWLREFLVKGPYENQTDMADAFKVTQPTISFWLSGHSTPDLDSCGHISEVTTKSVTDIYEMVRQDARETSTA
ncbi:hypothetical protein LCGC14_1134480 [marine sediment metagenome]|uniref:HTH cro/C1-type domain-containing protein n=1 Tax=marine sediment metagenome TaxID=412755 RepID=A0A0F9PIF0_9ZZZZ